MFMKKIFAVVVLCFGYSMLQAQVKQTENLQQVWLGYFNQTRFTDKLGAWTDLQLRTKDDFVNKFSQSIVRVGLTYYVTDATKLTVGYAYISHYPADAHKKITQPEHRPWQQVQWHTKYGKKRMMQWFRLEERFRRKIQNDSTLADGYNFNFRLRYNFFYDVPLTPGGIKPGAISFVVNDEVHINFGEQIVSNYFDQNRFFLGFKYQLSELDNLQLGYMNVFQQLPAGNKYKSTDIIRLFYFQNLDWRKPKATK